MAGSPAILQRARCLRAPRRRGHSANCSWPTPTFPSGSGRTHRSIHRMNRRSTAAGKRDTPTIRRLVPNSFKAECICGFHDRCYDKASMTSGTRSTILWPIVLLLVTPLGQTLRSETRSPREYRLRFYHTHSNERLDIVYRRGGAHVPGSPPPVRELRL